MLMYHWTWLSTKTDDNAIGIWKDNCWSSNISQLLIDIAHINLCVILHSSQVLRLLTKGSNLWTTHLSYLELPLQGTVYLILLIQKPWVLLKSAVSTAAEA